MDVRVCSEYKQAYDSLKNNLDNMSVLDSEDCGLELILEDEWYAYLDKFVNGAYTELGVEETELDEAILANEPF